MGKTGAVVALLAIAALGAAGCVAKAFAEPEIVAGSESTVSIKAGSWRSAAPLARRHCRRFGRKAMARGGGVIGYDQLMSLYAFDCAERRRGR